MSITPLPAWVARANVEAALREPKRLGATSGKHLYSLGVEGPESSIEVSADTRTQAGAIAKRAGYVVRDVNMIG